MIVIVYTFGLLSRSAIYTWLSFDQNILQNLRGKIPPDTLIHIERILTTGAPAKLFAEFSYSPYSTRSNY